MDKQGLGQLPAAGSTRQTLEQEHAVVLRDLVRLAELLHMFAGVNRTVGCELMKQQVHGVSASFDCSILLTSNHLHTLHLDRGSSGFFWRRLS